jgi:hypothetical protein
VIAGGARDQRTRLAGCPDSLTLPYPALPCPTLPCPAAKTALTQVIKDTAKYPEVQFAFFPLERAKYAFTGQCVAGGGREGASAPSARSQVILCGHGELNSAYPPPRGPLHNLSPCGAQPLCPAVVNH